jgi:hypothetical protein
VAVPGGGEDRFITVKAVDWMRVMNEWELDCNSCPVLAKDRRKKLWEILIPGSLFSAPCTMHHPASSLPIHENHRVGLEEGGGCTFAILCVSPILCFG